MVATGLFHRQHNNWPSFGLQLFVDVNPICEKFLLTMKNVAADIRKCVLVRNAVSKSFLVNFRKIVLWRPEISFHLCVCSTAFL